MVRQGLFPLGSTEVSTAPTAEAAQAFLAALDPDQLILVTRPLDSLDWRRWFNVHLFMYRRPGQRHRQGGDETQPTPGRPHRQYR